MKVSLVGLAAAFVYCAYVQLNDPDPEIWITLYLTTGREILLEAYTPKGDTSFQHQFMNCIFLYKKQKTLIVT